MVVYSGSCKKAETKPQICVLSLRRFTTKFFEALANSLLLNDQVTTNNSNGLCSLTKRRAMSTKRLGTISYGWRVALPRN